MLNCCGSGSASRRRNDAGSAIPFGPGDESTGLAQTGRSGTLSRHQTDLGLRNANAKEALPARRSAVSISRRNVLPRGCGLEAPPETPRSAGVKLRSSLIVIEPLFDPLH